MNRSDTSFLTTLAFITLISVAQVVGQTWEQISATGAITGHTNASAILRPVGNEIILFGGKTNAGNSNALWSFDLGNNKWNEIPTNAAEMPAPRSTHNAMYDAKNDRMIIWSGQGSQLYNDIWAFHFSDSTWTELWPDGNTPGAPLKRYGTGAVFDSTSSEMVTFAGFTTSGRFEDTWRFDLGKQSWAEVSVSNHPIKRCLFNACFAPDRREMIIFGGQSTGNLNDIWKFSTGDLVWEELSPTQSPGARHFASLNYVGSGQVIMYAGNSANQNNYSGALDDVWRFSTDQQQWDSLPQYDPRPVARLGHVAVYLPGENALWIYGGNESGGSLNNEVWKYSIPQVSGNEPSTESEIAFKLYPNPTGGVLHVELRQSTFHPEAEIFDQWGRRVTGFELDRNALRIKYDVTGLAPGVYKFRVGSAVEPFVVIP